MNDLNTLARRLLDDGTHVLSDDERHAVLACIRFAQSMGPMFQGYVKAQEAARTQATP